MPIQKKYVKAVHEVYFLEVLDAYWENAEAFVKEYSFTKVCANFTELFTNMRMIS